MTISNGTCVGPYQIISLIGVGGMGEVYRAHDTRLARDVAIKILPASLANDKDRLLRFEQEARATSAINHPNILTVYDFGTTSQGAPFIVAELLDGEELREHLNDGPMSPRKAIDYAHQAASGLAAAHSKGVIHRDLKPENLFVTNDGRLKILDFGLAKLKPIALATEVETQIDITNPGVVMGTVGYMSPEQVLGDPVDHRSDIFSFGVVLYEMLSGERTFKGQSAFEVINAILKEDPRELSDTNTKVSPALEKIVRRCLEKDPNRRFQSTTDLCFAIETLSTPSYSPLQTIPANSRRLFSTTRLIWIVGAIIFAGLLGLLPLVFSNFHRESEVRTVQSFIPEPENFGINSGVFSISPDGRYLAFAGVLPGKQLLWVRSLSDVGWRAIAATEGATFPFWSADSRSVGFFADGKLKRIDVAGGPPLTLCDAPDGFGGTWNTAGVIIFSPTTFGPLYRVSASGGSATAVTKVERGSATWDRWPSFLPDDHHFLYAREDGVYVGSLDSQESKLLVRAASSPIYAQGYLLFLRERTLMAQPFDTKTLQFTAEALPIAEQISTWAFRGAFSTSRDGILVHRTGQARGTHAQLAWLDRSGKQQDLIGNPDLYPNLHLSPDEQKVALTTGGGKRRVSIYDLERNVATRLTPDQEEVTEAVWSPDGHRLVFNSTRNSSFNLYTTATDGSGGEELLVASDAEKYPTSWSPRDDYILYDVFSPSSVKADVWVLGRGKKPFPFLQTAANESRAQFSPDGRWVLYTSDESGRDEVYVTSFPDRGGKLLISKDGGTYPRWRRDGKEIFYLAPDGKLMSVDAKLAATTVKVGEPHALFEFRPANLYRNGYPYDVTSDGKRFLVNVATENKEQTYITLVQNWSASLKK